MRRDVDYLDALDRAVDCGCVELEPGSVIGPETEMGRARIAFHLAFDEVERAWEQKVGRGKG